MLYFANVPNNAMRIRGEPEAYDQRMQKRDHAVKEPPTKLNHKVY